LKDVLIFSYIRVLFSIIFLSKSKILSTNNIYHPKITMSTTIT
jgi:hypothetical protein